MRTETVIRVAFCVAASRTIGGGHVVRSLAIADALRAAGSVCTFFVDQEAIAAAPLLARSGHRLVTISRDIAAVAHAKDMGIYDWAVMDDYGLMAAQETPWRDVAKNIMVVDDLANRMHDCDLLLDSTPSRQAADYAGLVPRGARLLLGHAYSPLRPEFAQQRPCALARRAVTQKPQRLLISFGLLDPGGITADAVAAVGAALPDLAMDVVLSPACESQGKIEALARPNIALHIDPPSMSELMIAADIALGAAGSTAWERACLGLPSIALILADNQQALARDLERHGALRAIEKSTQCWPQVIAALRLLCDDPPQWQTASLKAAQVCDGLGAQRLAAELNPPHSKSGLPVHLRTAGLEDTN